MALPETPYSPMILMHLWLWFRHDPWQLVSTRWDGITDFGPAHMTLQTLLPFTRTPLSRPTNYMNHVLDRLHSPGPSELCRKRKIQKNTPPVGKWRSKGDLSDLLLNQFTVFQLVCCLLPMNLDSIYTIEQVACGI